MICSNIDVNKSANQHVYHFLLCTKYKLPEECDVLSIWSLKELSRYDYLFYILTFLKMS